MTPKERFQTTLKIHEPDRVPWTPFFLGASNRIYGASSAQRSQYGDIAAKCMLASQKFFGFDVMIAGFDAYTESAGFGQEILFPEDDPAYPDPDKPVIRTPDDFARLTPYDPKQSDTRTWELLDCCDMLMNEAGGNFPVIGMVNGPLTVLSALCGTDSLVSDCGAYREAVSTGLETVSNVLAEYTKALAETGVMIMFDLSCASRRYMDRQLWLETEGRLVSRLAETARKAGASVAVHVRGEGAYFDRIIETASPQMIATPFVPDDCADWAEAKRKWGDKVALLGAVSNQTLVSGKPEEVKASCRQLIRDMGSGGGFVLAPGCEYPPKANLHGARAMKEVIAQHGAYPLEI